MINKKIDIIVTAFNEESCVEELARRLKNVMNDEENYEFTVLFVENGSTDSTFDLIHKIHEEDTRFKIIKLSKNFRMDGGLTAGLNYANGDSVIFMSADLQDPPEVIPLFIRNWEQGYSNVYAEIQKRNGTPLLRRINSKIFYFLANKLTKGLITPHVSDFRLLDKSAYEILRKMEEKNRFMRGLVSWLGFNSIGVKIDRPERHGGKSKAYTFQVIDLAIKGIFAHTLLPLRFAVLLGLLTFFLSSIALIVLPIIWLSFGVPFAGFGSLFALILLLFSILFIILGIMSEYIGLVYEEVKNRPNFIVEQTFGID